MSEWLEGVKEGTPEVETGAMDTFSEEMDVD